MANQIIKIKRSTTPGSRPSVGSLQLGELAMNVVDGNIFFERSGSTNSVEQVITSTPTTASLLITGSHQFTGPFLIRRNNGQLAFEVKTQGYVVFGEYTGSITSLTPETGSLIYSGSELFFYS